MALLSPGVLVKEIDLTTIIPSVATTEGGMAGAFNWGPLNQRVLIDSENELVETFGKPDNVNANDWWTAANFLAYANKLFVVRVADESNANTDLRVSSASIDGDLTVLVKNDDDYYNNFADGSLDSIFGSGPWIAKYPGALGNSLKISVCPSANAFQSTLAGTLSIVAEQTAVTGVGTNFTADVIVGDLLVLNNETHKIASIANTTVLELSTRHVAGAVANTVVRRWEHYVEVAQGPNTSDNAEARGAADDEMHIVVVDKDGLWTGRMGQVLEIYQGVSKGSGAKASDGSSNYYVDVVNTRSKYVRWAAHDGTITNSGTPIAVGGTYGSPDLPITSSFQSGSNGALIGNDEKIRGYNLFRSHEDVDVSFILGSDAVQTIAVHIINNICEVRKDCIAFLSPPRAYVVNNVGNEADDVVLYRNTLPSTSYATLDNNWKYQYDLYNDIYRYVPMNGDVAGAYARSDVERDPWYAAAGLNRGHMKNVIKLAWNPREADRDMLYKNGVNPIVTFPGDGTVLFGNKTLLAKPSAFDRMNVRRLFIVLEKAISKASRYLLFEFNDEFTRATFRNMVEPYLRDVQGRRGIYDFKVVCDETNNTPEVIDRNEFIGDMYIKPARTAEFITLNFIATRTGVSFDEVIGRFG